MGFFPKRQAPIHGTPQSHGALQIQAVPSRHGVFTGVTGSFPPMGVTPATASATAWQVRSSSW